MRIEKFTEKSIEFELRTLTLDDGVEVKLLHNGQQLARYTATYETASAMHRHGWGNAIDHLIEFAKADVVHDQLPGLKAIRAAA